MEREHGKRLSHFMNGRRSIAHVFMLELFVTVVPVVVQWMHGGILKKVVPRNRSGGLFRT